MCWAQEYPHWRYFLWLEHIILRIADISDNRAQQVNGPPVDISPLTDVVTNLSRTYYEMKTEYELWHPRLAHISPKLAMLAKPDIKWPKKIMCDDCIRGKFHKHPHSGSRPPPSELPWAPGEYFTCDLFGPLLRSAGGARYVAFYLDLKSRFVYAKVLKDKTGHYQSFLDVIQDAKARSGKAMRFFKTDGDGIFTGREANDIYSQFSIRHIQSAPGDSASNDVAERIIRTIAELARTNLLHAGAPPSLWAEAVTMVTFVWNNITTCVDPYKPHSHLSRVNLLEGHKRQYDLSNLRAFGTKCFSCSLWRRKVARKWLWVRKHSLGLLLASKIICQPTVCLIFPIVPIVTHEGHYPFSRLVHMD